MGYLESTETIHWANKRTYERVSCYASCTHPKVAEAIYFGSIVCHHDIAPIRPAVGVIYRPTHTT